MTKTNYQSPEVTIMEMEAQALLCQSSYDVAATSLEAWDYEEFQW